MWSKKLDKKIYTQFVVPKYFNTPILYTTDAHFYKPLVKIGSLFCFSSSDMQKFHHLLGCNTIGIISSHIFFLKCFAFLKFNMPRQKSDMNNSIRIIFIKIIIKINIIKIYIKNTHFFTRKYDIIRIFIKVEYNFICLQSSKKFFNYFTCDKPIRNKFNVAREVLCITYTLYN